MMIFQELPAVSGPLLIVAILFCGIVCPSFFIWTFLERKILADAELRVGPRMVGLAGFFQPVIDSIKLLQKQPSGRQGPIKLWLLLSWVGLFLCLACFPVSSGVILLDSEFSILLLIIYPALVRIFGLFILPENTRPLGWLSSVRQVGQALNGLPGVLLCLMTVGMELQAFEIKKAVGIQGFYPTEWMAFKTPFMFIAFLVFFMGGMGTLGEYFFSDCKDGAEFSGASKLRMNGADLLIFNFIRFFTVYLWTHLTVTLFLGGWNLEPHWATWLADREWAIGIVALEIFIVHLKAGILFLALALYSRANPLPRFDQVSQILWRIFTPFGLVAFFGTAIWRFVR